MSQYRVVRETHGHEFDIGDIVVPLETSDPNNGRPFYRKDGDPNDYWYLWFEEYEEITDAKV